MDIVQNSNFNCESYYYYYLIELHMGFLPGDSGTTMRHNTKKIHISHKITRHAKKKQRTKLQKQLI
jgi:hypothetical protein